MIQVTIYISDLIIYNMHANPAAAGFSNGMLHEIRFGFNSRITTTQRPANRLKLSLYFVVAHY